MTNGFYEIGITIRDYIHQGDIFRRSLTNFYTFKKLSNKVLSFQTWGVHLYGVGSNPAIRTSSNTYLM